MRRRQTKGPISLSEGCSATQRASVRRRGGGGGSLYIGVVVLFFSQAMQRESNDDHSQGIGISPLEENEDNEDEVSGSSVSTARMMIGLTKTPGRVGTSAICREQTSTPSQNPAWALFGLCDGGGGERIKLSYEGCFGLNTSCRRLSDRINQYSHSSSVRGKPIERVAVDASHGRDQRRMESSNLSSTRADGMSAPAKKEGGKE